MTKFDVAIESKGAKLTFDIRINDQYLIKKTVTELVEFCRALHVWAKGKN